MPIRKEEDELEDRYMFDDDSSDEEESGDNSDSEESGSDSSDSSDSEESGSASDSDSDSDDDDSDSDDDSGSGSGSGSDSDDSDSDTKKKEKNDKSDDQKDEESQSPPNTIYKLRQISSKLSVLLDDIHKTFKPKSVPQIDPKKVFPYPYEPIPQYSPQSKHYKPKYNHDVVIHSSHHLKSPISSPIRHGNNIDRGTGGNYIFPSYAAPPSTNEIAIKLYQNYSDTEKGKIAENQKRERLRKFLFSRKSPNDECSKSDSNLWEHSDFADEFIAASRNQQNQKIGISSRFKLFVKKREREKENKENIDEAAMPHTFEELYKNYDRQKALIQQKQQKMNKMKNTLNWFRKNNAQQKNMAISEKKPLMNRPDVAAKNDSNEREKEEQLFPSQKSLKETENNLLNKAAQILLRNRNVAKPSTNKYDQVRMCPDSPDSLQQKIIRIASDDDAENRVPTFV